MKDLKLRKLKKMGDYKSAEDKGKKVFFKFSSFLES